MEAETTENVTETSPGIGDTVRANEDFGTLLLRCGLCKESVQNRRPKLLSCLHTFCQQCIGSLETGENGQITCCVCRQVSMLANMIDNMFVPTVEVSAAAATPAVDGDSDRTVAHSCTGCEENVAANHYCTDCGEWLCEPCAQAHRRVKVTKNHNVEQISQMSPSGAASSGNSSSATSASKRSSLVCATHPKELLKLYCETCVKLTCRDCQLGEHRNHKYQFVQEAAVACRSLLQSLLTKIREKQSHIENAKSLIDRRNTEIAQKERTVANEIKSHAQTLMSQINQKGRQLLGELQAVCNAKRRQLDQKNTEIRLLSDNLHHGLRFAEYLLTLTDDATLLYSKRTLMHQLSAILRTRCEVPNPYHVVDLRFNSSQLFASPHWSIGTLVVDGYQYGQRGPSASAASAANGRVTSSSPHGYVPAVTSARGEPVQQLSGEQKLQKLQMMLQMRRMEQQRIVPKQPTGAGLPTYAGGSNVVAGTGTSSYPSHMPNQSSNISSSNQHRHDASGSYAASTGYLPKTYAAPHSISLAQLQEKHHQQMQNHHEQVTTTLQPIIIQPTNLPDQMRSPSPGSSTDMRFGYRAPSTEQDDSHKSLPSSSIATSPTASQSLSLAKPDDGKSSATMLMDIKKESEAAEMTFGGNARSTSRSRTPTPRIESTSQELGNSPSALGARAAAVSPAASDGQCVKYDTSGLSDTAAATGNSDGIFTVQNDGVFASGSVDLSEALSSWPDLKVNMATETATVSNSDRMSPVQNDGVLPSEAARLSGWPDLKENGDNLTFSGNQTDNAQSCSQQTTASVDPNEDYCAVCRNGGDLLCCDNCPRVYHVPCHVPMIASFPSDNSTWICTMCAASEDSLRLEAPDSRQDVSTAKRRSSSAGLTDRELKVCERLLLDLFTFESSFPFHAPVSKSIPNYYKIIVSPMDLGTIRSRLNKTHFNHYQSVEEFVADVQLVFTNCATFNPPDSAIGKAGIATHAYFLSRLAKLLPYVDLQTTAAVTEQLSRPAVKRRKPNPKSTKELVSATTIDKEENSLEAVDNN